MTDSFKVWLQTVCKDFSELKNEEKTICLKELIELCGPSQLFSLWHQFSPVLHCDFLQYLPLEIVYKILRYVQIEHALQCRLVSRKWNQVICRCIPLWKSACSDVGVNVDNVLFKNKHYSAWRKLYLQCRTKLKAVSNTSCYVETKLAGHTLPVRAVKYYQTLLATGSDDRTVRIWRKINDQFHCNHVLQTHSCAALKCDANIILTASFDTSAAAWNWQSGQLIQRFKGHTGAVYCLDYDLDQDLLVTGSTDKTVKIWKLSSGSLLKTLRHDEWILEVKLAKSLVNGVKFDKEDLLLIVKTRHILSISIIAESFREKLIYPLTTLNKDDQFYPTMQFNGHVIACAAASGLYFWSISSLCCIKFIPSEGDKRLVSFGSALTVILYRRFEGDILRIIDTKTGLERAAISFSDTFEVIEPCTLNWLDDISMIPMDNEPLFVMSPSATRKLDFNVIIVQWKDLKKEHVSDSV